MRTIRWDDPTFWGYYIVRRLGYPSQATTQPNTPLQRETARELRRILDNARNGEKAITPFEQVVHLYIKGIRRGGEWQRGSFMLNAVGLLDYQTVSRILVFMLV